MPERVEQQCFEPLFSRVKLTVGFSFESSAKGPAALMLLLLLLMETMIRDEIIVDEAAQRFGLAWLYQRHGERPAVVILCVADIIRFVVPEKTSHEVSQSASNGNLE